MNDVEYGFTTLEFNLERNDDDDKSTINKYNETSIHNILECSLDINQSSLDEESNNRKFQIHSNLKFKDNSPLGLKFDSNLLVNHIFKINSKDIFIADNINKKLQNQILEN